MAHQLEFDQTPTKTMDTLSLVSTNNNTAKSCALFEQEDSISVATFCLVSTSTRATIVAGVGLGGSKSSSGLDGDRLAQGRGSRRGREDICRTTAFQAVRGKNLIPHLVK
jgi:hypothetical protein